jgi:Ala-tRNA(Pro) deacylase
MSIQHRNKILELVQNAGVWHKHFEHEPVTTSEHASAIRGVALSSGAKAIVTFGKKSNTRRMFVIPAHKKLNTKKVKELVGEQISFVSDVGAEFDCVPGSVPPLGSVLGIQTYADNNLEETLNFNIGLLTESLQLKKEDYVKLEQPIMGDYSE